MSRDVVNLSTTMVNLSQGICTRLHNATPDDEELFNAEHTIQFVSIKKVLPTPNSSNPTDRYRMIISDGEHYVQAMLATQLNTLVEDGTIAKHSIAVIERLTCNYVQDKRLVCQLAPRMSYLISFSQYLDHPWSSGSLRP
jgi:replication factor A1